ncbi:helix-turn-helix transcriptional regulator [Nesterenkonia pannonica]|uniref:helix-turn-helix domain-containing protein n=1 Tax=Nesterenkonia pannonica TaxID=1548602 RepID=UPI00216470AC|nr:helix-turn-helix transcriptional regulator [Nesterenkonia pannonica]
MLEHLSSREQEIAFAVAEGNTNREVAEDLVISVRTVEYHVGNILQKLDLESRKELRQLLRAASVEQRA